LETKTVAVFIELAQHLASGVRINKVRLAARKDILESRSALLRLSYSYWISG